MTVCTLAASQGHRYACTCIAQDHSCIHVPLIISQFHRVLSELELGGLVNALEFVLLYRKFDVKIGGRNDVNYYAFCEMIDDYAQTKWTDPALK